MWTSLFSGTREEHNGREVTLQIEEKWEREAVITGREGKENEGDHEYMKGDEVGWRGAAISSSRYPPKLHKHSSTVTHKDWTVAKYFS